MTKVRMKVCMNGKQERGTRPEQANKQNDPHGPLETRPEKANKQNEPHRFLGTRPEKASKQNDPHGLLETMTEKSNKQNVRHWLLNTRPEKANKTGTPTGNLITKGTQPTQSTTTSTTSSRSRIRWGHHACPRSKDRRDRTLVGHFCVAHTWDAKTTSHAETHIVKTRCTGSTDLLDYSWAALEGEHFQRR